MLDKEELASDITERFTKWRPNARQADALQLPYDIFECLYGGALGGGKSEYGLMCPIVSRTIKSNIPLYQHPGFKGIIFRRTFPQLEHSLIPRAKYFYEAIGATYNENKKLFEFPDKNGILKAGGKIFLSQMENEKDCLKYDTDEYNYIFLDQAEQFTEFQLRYISSRARSSNPDLPHIYRISANPGGISHNYLKKRYVEPEKNGNVVLVDAKTKEKRIFIPAKLEDNPDLDKNDPTYRNRLQLLPESERKAKIEGDWYSFTGQMFGEFRELRIPGEPENAIHICRPFVIPSFWPRVLAIDWGFKAQTFAIWGAIGPNKRVYIYRCYGVKGKTTRVWAADIGRLSQDEHIVRNPLDPSAWQERGADATIAQVYEECSGLIPEKADNNREQGIEAIHEYLRWEPKPPKVIPSTGYDLNVANRIMRIHGMKAFHEYNQLFEPEAPETNLPKLQIFEHSASTGTKPLIETIPIVQYHEKNKEDYAEFEGDDPIDDLRYFLKACSVYIEDVLAKTNYFEKEAEILQELNTDQDQFKFYQKMAYLESQQKLEMPRPVRIYR